MNINSTIENFLNITTKTFTPICPNDQTKLIKCSPYGQKIEEPKAFKKNYRPFKKVALLCVKIHCIVATIMEPINKRKKPEAKHSTLQKKDKGNFIQNEHQISLKRSCRKYRTMNQNCSCCRKKIFWFVL